jgi:hypothetical protein
MKESIAIVSDNLIHNIMKACTGIFKITMLYELHP